MTIAEKTDLQRLKHEFLIEGPIKKDPVIDTELTDLFVMASGNYQEVLELLLLQFDDFNDTLFLRLLESSVVPHVDQDYINRVLYCLLQNPQNPTKSFLPFNKEIAFVIDGLGAAGKGTIVRELAKFGIKPGVSAGLFYRTLSRLVLDFIPRILTDLKENIESNSPIPELSELTNGITDIDISETEEGKQSVTVQHAVHGEISYSHLQLRSREVNNIISDVAGSDEGTAFVDAQQEQLLLKLMTIVYEGRDVATRAIKLRDKVSKLVTMYVMVELEEKMKREILRSISDGVVEKDKIMKNVFSLLKRDLGDTSRQIGAPMVPEVAKKSVLDNQGIYDIYFNSTGLSKEEVTIVVLATLYGNFIESDHTIHAFSQFIFDRFCQTFQRLGKDNLIVAQRNKRVKTPVVLEVLLD